MKRDEMLARVRSAPAPWDVVIVGGGATGLGCALDAASRGLRTALFEAGDFACATSSRSTKLIHGGVRYLRSGQIGLVAHSLRERERLRRNAPGLVHDLEFVVPAYRFGERAFYGAGLALYDLLSGAIRDGRASHDLVPARVQRMFPALRRRGLRGGTLYHDGQFDDARLALALARTAVGRGAAVVNYARVDTLLRRDGRVAGVGVTDTETGAAFEVPARAVINAAGVFADTIRKMDDPGTADILRASRGAHLVVAAESFPGHAAMLLPHTDDGRVLFLIPWRGRVLVGTTDSATDTIESDVRPTDADVAYLLDHASRYLERPLGTGDVRSTFAGLRPLLAGSGPTSSLRRDHRVVVSRGGLVTITGGKWTTYRRMAEDAVDAACSGAGVACGRSLTTVLALDTGDASETRDAIERFVCGDGDAPSPDEARAIEAFIADAAAHDMARHVEDALARRSRALFLDAARSATLADMAAKVLADALGRDEAWAKAEADAFRARARRYLPALAGQ